MKTKKREFQKLEVTRGGTLSGLGEERKGGERGDYRTGSFFNMGGGSKKHNYHPERQVLNRQTTDSNARSQVLKKRRG